MKKLKYLLMMVCLKLQPVCQQKPNCSRSTVSRYDLNSHTISEVWSFIWFITASSPDSVVYKEVNHWQDLCLLLWFCWDREPVWVMEAVEISTLLSKWSTIFYFFIICLQYYFSICTFVIMHVWSSYHQM